MKYIAVLFLLVSCSHKYQTIEVIKKKEFLFGQEHSPITPKAYPRTKQHAEFCTGQWFFSNNAVRDTHEQLNRIVRVTCPKDDFLLNSKVTETWWTTLVYSRACIELDTHCPVIQNNRSSKKSKSKKRFKRN